MASSSSSSSAAKPAPPDFFIHFQGSTFHVNKRSMLAKCAKLAVLLQQQPRLGHPPPSSYTVTGISADPAVFDMAASFCHGYEAGVTAETAIPLACLAHFLGMTDDHCPDNLFGKTTSLISSEVLPRWNETVAALKSAEPVLELAAPLGLVDACLESIAEKVLANPQIITGTVEEYQSSGGIPPAAGGATRWLFCAEDPAAPESLTSLKLDLFVLVVSALADSGVQEEHIAGCLYQYLKSKEGEEAKQKEVVEAIERLLPATKGVLHVKLLFELLRSALSSQASMDCRNGLEARIGKQLPQATVADLLIPTYGYANETSVICTRRIVEHFCADDGSSPALPELKAVADLMEDYLHEVAPDRGLNKETFTSVLELLAAVVASAGRFADGVYRAIDTYLDAHENMTESEREEVCRALVPTALSPDACEHAARNERLPLRVVAQVLFIGQVRMREAIASALVGLDDDDAPNEDEQEEDEEGKGMVVATEGGGGAGEVMEEIARIRSRMGELEEECGRMRKEIERCMRCGGGIVGIGRRKKKKRGFWGEVRGILGCREGVYQCNCCAQRVHPK